MPGPIKRSVMIAGHATSVSLEPAFWEGLNRAARDEGLPLSALVARIDAERVGAPDAANLASAIRVWLYERALATDQEASRSASSASAGSVDAIQPPPSTLSPE